MTGRAKLQDAGAEDSGRLILYAGYAFMLIGMLVCQPWARFMNATFDWCGVGFSWMNGGANRFAKRFKADKGWAPKGYRYVSVDIKEWDTKLHRSLMYTLVRFYDGLLHAVGVPKGFRKVFSRVLNDMIEATVLLPMGYLVQVFQGMKSGWCNTANDNTLIHEIVFRCIMRTLGWIDHVLYGDDNFMLVPDHITDQMLIEQYMRFGLVVKTIHSSRKLSEVDYLSKHIVYCMGNYYVFRNSVDTHARLLMPEELDPNRRDRPDAVVAAERCLGHLLDNPFNSNVREICYDLLSRLKKQYGVDFVEVHDGLKKQHPWRWFDVSKIPRRFPTVPSMAFIEELYGVPIPTQLDVVFPVEPSVKCYNPQTFELDCLKYDLASDYADTVRVELQKLGRVPSKQIVRKLSPFRPPKQCYGFHAARFEFAIKHFSIKFHNLLDLGSHPGACAASALKYCSSVVCVSKQHPDDTRAFCPYVFRDERVKIVRTDADHFVPYRPFDLVHDDVDIDGPRTRKDDIEVGKATIRRARMNAKMCHQALFTLREIDISTMNDLYELYKDYGHIDFVKPFFSSPWRSEFMVYCRKERVGRMRKRNFLHSFNSFLNSMAGDLITWSDVVADVVVGYSGMFRVPECPYKRIDHEKDWIRPWVGRHGLGLRRVRRLMSRGDG
jgi:hypothetical protein